MLRRLALGTMSVVIIFALGCGQAPVSPSSDPPAFAPADNGSKDVLTVDETFFPVCPGGAVLTAHLGGWIQFMGGSGRNLDLTVFHLVFRFTNAAGKTFLFPDVGPDRVYVKDGSLFLAITGRSSGGQFIGHVVFDLATGDAVLVAGKQLRPLLEQACEALS